MELIRIPHWRGAALQVAHVAPCLGNDQGAFELTGVGSVDTEVGGEFQWTADAFGDVTERTIAEHSRIQRRVEIIGVGHDRSQILLDQRRMVLYRLGKGTKDHPGFSKL